MSPSWELIVILQIFVSAVMTLFTRRVSLSVAKVFFGVGVLSYCAVAIAGWCYLIVATNGHIIPIAPHIWPYLLVEGIAIPAAWLIQYRLIRYIGASNAVIVTTLNLLAAATIGVIFLHDQLSLAFVAGGALVLAGVLSALHLQPDTSHHIRVSLIRKITLVICGAFLFAVGMASEKVAVDQMGAWQYMGTGWTMQAIGALALFVLFGRHEIAHITQPVVQRGLLLGTLTSIAGALYIYAVSIGTLSHTIVATSGKTALIMVLAAIFLGERNAPWRRVLAFGLTSAGLWLILQ